MNERVTTLKHLLGEQDAILHFKLMPKSMSHRYHLHKVSFYLLLNTGKASRGVHRREVHQLMFMFFYCFYDLICLSKQSISQSLVAIDCTDANTN